MRQIYLASSWRNAEQPFLVRQLRAAGHEVYDFRNPAPGNTGFHWSEIDPQYHHWTPQQYREALAHPIAQSGWYLDQSAMDWADTCVLLLPSGKSAHIEAGYMAGEGKDVFIYTPGPTEPELMYLSLLRHGGRLCVSIAELIRDLTN
jgi:hypothetical protein